MSTLDLRFSRTAPRHDLAGALVARDRWSWASALQRAARLLPTWHRRTQQRRHLRALNDHLLRDIGLTRADVLAEASKPFWQG